MSSLLQRALDARAHDPARPMTPRDIEFVECLLYQALDTARRKRQQMDRMAWSTEYADLYREREAAIETAKRHLRALRERSAPIDELLQSMLRAEEITS
jgi:hypothetical protein